MIETAKRFTGWYILAGVLLILLGLLAIIKPATAAVSIALLRGWLLIFGGAHFIATFRGSGAKRVLFQILSVFVLGGLYVLTHPLLAIGPLTALLAVVIFVQWPSGSASAIATLIGVNLLMTGITRVVVGLAGRRLIKHATA